jgi:tryptophanyl-tRNA synthetase
MFTSRVLSGMRPTGKLHLGHYHGALKNWVRLQHEYDCLFMVADWHALTTNYDNVTNIEESTWDMVIDWLASGIDPTQASIFIQSKVPQHAELYLALSMICPLSWLERMPTYKDQIEKLSQKDLFTYGFLGYPLLQSADILVYRANLVPVGEDQAPHVELTREIARRFNHLFGRETGFEEKAQAAIKQMGSKKARLYETYRKAFQQEGDEAALAAAHALIADTQNLTQSDSTRLYAFLENKSKVILPEAEVLLTETSRLPGLDGEKMSKSYGNTITLRETPEQVTKKVRAMTTDPARVRRTDPGSPDKCPVWQFHQVYSSPDTQAWVKQGCTQASIGCLDCKQPVIDGILKEQQPMFERAQRYLDDPNLVKAIVADGCERAQKLATETMKEVKDVMGLPS